jgi:peptide/nickel transport system substrate-binding protein
MLVVTMDSPYSPMLATFGLANIVSPKALDANASDDAAGYLSENAAGTGPYTLKSWERDQSMTLNRFPDYWRGWAGKHVDTVVLRFVAEQATQRQLVQRGEAQLAMAIAADDLAQLKADMKMRVYNDPSIREYVVRFDNQRPPLNDLRVRQALIAAYDYKTGVEQVLAGNGSIPQGYVPTAYRTHNKALGPEEFDMQKAKQLLDAAGVSNLQFTCTYIGNLDVQRQAAELWQANLAKLGVTLKLNPQPWATMVERSTKAETRDNSGFFAFNYGYPEETSAQWSTLATNTNAAWGNYGYKNDRIDELLNKALVTIDDAERTKLLQEAQKVARDDAATLNVWIFNDWVVATESLKGYKYDPSRPTIPRFYELYFE